ncbi:MAG: ABC transporter ATP-binding protein [Candidatus Marinimicrobia bacterium]|nr:ABC transporter ATP-binding protein [Candidatus Neomarinimicrobiota bacterium]
MRIQLSGLDFQYKVVQQLFRNINLSIPLQRRVVITGDSGSGKTSLVKLISGLLKPDKGQIIFEINGAAQQDIHFGYLFQNPDDQFVHFNIERELAFNLENRGMSSAGMQVKATETLEEIDLIDRKSDSPNSLSGGEKQRLALAGMMITQPDILIMDEPCSFLDIFAQIRLYKKIDMLGKQGVSIIWISQETHEIRMADYVIALDQGQVIYRGNSSEYLKIFRDSDYET